MTVIFKKKDSFDTAQYNNVTSITFNPSTKVYGIVSSGGTTSYDGNNWYMFVLMV